ncbi:MAG: hypothetical protein OXN88_04735 [Chloroflexota bacterium]|nr:hypothetical protein [Chloroflexota bacterium]
MKDAKTKGYACPRCTVGRCSPQTTTFADVYHGQLLCLPNVRAYRCDVCHFAEFESETLEALWEELYGEGPTDDYQSIAGQKRSSTYGGGST